MAARTNTGIVEFGREALSELRKVTWPTREAVVRLTLVVLVISTLVSLYIYVFDNLFTITLTNGLLGSPSPTPGPAAP